MDILYSMMRRFLRYRYPWRLVGFDEVAELYVSNLLRIIAITMVMTLSMVYLYKLGYSLAFIASYFGLYYLVRMAAVWPAAYIIARYGPKHATMISNLLWVPGLVSLSMIEVGGIWALALFALSQAFCTALFDIAFHVNFSKVRHIGHVGKEIGTMRLLQQIGRAISPVLGGLVAYWLGPQATILLAASIFLLAATPLMATPEPVATRQRIHFRGIPLGRIRGALLAEFSIGADFVASVSMWTLFIAIVVFGTAGNEIYAELGFVSSVTVLAALFVARVYGHIIDRQKGDDLLNAAALGNIMVYALRPLVATPLSIVLINIINELATSGYMMPYLRGHYAMADELPGYRIVYFSLMEMALGAGAAACFLLVALVSAWGMKDAQALIVGFAFAAVTVPLLYGRRFPRSF